MASRILLTIICLFLGVNAALAIMPPHVYKERIEKSKIKAIAIVEDVTVEDFKSTHKKNGIQTLKVRFKLVKAFSKNVPEQFIGYCKSYKGAPKYLPVGGAIYMHPNKGEQVFVAISGDNGFIHAYNRLTEELKEELNKNGLKNVEPGIGKIFYK